MPDPAVAEVVETPIENTPSPLGEVDSLAEYRERRDKGDTGEPADPTLETEPIAEEPKAEEPTAEVEAASQAGKALAAKKGSLQARINELTREKGQTASEAAAAKAESAALKAELAALKAGKAETKAEEKPAEVVADPKDPEPKIEAFEDYEKYTKALARWEARQEIRADREARAKQDAESARGSRLAQVQRDASEAHPDFQEKAAAYEAAGGTYSGVAQQIILTHAQGHEFAYALISDPAIAARINGAETPYAAMLEAGAVLAELRGTAAAKVEPKAKPVSKAPAPVQPVAGESAASEPDPSKMNSLAEYRRVRAKLMAA